MRVVCTHRWAMVPLDDHYAVCIDCDNIRRCEHRFDGLVRVTTLREISRSELGDLKRRIGVYLAHLEKWVS